MNKEIDEGFVETCKALFQISLESLEEYCEWVGEKVPLPRKTISSISGKEVWVPPPETYLGVNFENSRIVAHDEIGKIKTRYTKEDIKGISLRNIEKIMRPVVYYLGDFRLGKHSGFEKTSAGGNGENVYYSEDIYHKVKNIAFCHYTAFSEYMFGCYNVPSSSFCVHCYHSTKLSRCFELDGCTSCRDCMFCHNCEGLKDCIMCFNAKNLRYAVGNIEIGKQEYLRIRKILTDYIVRSLNKEKRIGLNIYNIGCIKQ